MAKDRAAPFSRKHRRTWLPVTGGMILIGAVNVSIGMCSYRAPVEPEPMQVVIPSRDAALDAPGTLGASKLPVEVMRAFNARYPRTIPAGARTDGAAFVVTFSAGAPHRSATFQADGTFVSED